MLRNETNAYCSGCGYCQVGVSELPSSWSRLLDGDELLAFCSRNCLIESRAGMATATRRLPLGMEPLDVRILEDVAQGYANKEIAARQGLAESTVKNRMTRVFAALGAQDRTQAVLIGHAVGLLNLNTLAHVTAARLSRAV